MYTYLLQESRDTEEIPFVSSTMKGYSHITLLSVSLYCHTPSTHQRRNAIVVPEQWASYHYHQCSNWLCSLLQSDNHSDIHVKDEEEVEVIPGDGTIFIHLHSQKLAGDTHTESSAFHPHMMSYSFLCKIPTGAMSLGRVQIYHCAI